MITYDNIGKTIFLTREAAEAALKRRRTMNNELTENGTFINIEYHKSRVSELEKQLAKYDEIAAEYGIDGKTMLTLAKSQIEIAKENIVLREVLEESQRREKAAVEDLRDSANCDSVCKHGRCNDNDCEIGRAHV